MVSTVNINQWRLANKERISLYNKEYAKKHKERDKDRKIKNLCRYHERYYEKQLLNFAEKRAKIKGLEFNLESSDIVIPEYCPYLKIPLTKIRGAGYTNWSNASIDRIDNSKGYTKDNIQVISRQANQMKAHATKEQLLVFAKSILELYE